MRIAYMGNGPFAVPALESLHASPHEVVQVVARPDRPRGKSQRIEPGPVALTATTLGLSLAQPDDVNAESFVEELANLAPDLLVVADFGQILRQRCLDAASKGGINIHASLLPSYRGAAPIAWAIYHGESETGVTIIQMSRRLDSGGILAMERTPIASEETAGELEVRLAQMGATLACKVTDALQDGTISATEQNDSQASLAPKLTKDDGKIDWNRTARQLHDQTRALDPWPGCFTHWVRPEGAPVRMKLLSVDVADPSGAPSAVPGTVVEAEGGKLIIATGTGTLSIARLQPAGKKPLDTASFLRGHRVRPGDQFE
ncbi:Methionyl-tRNA formyltransferase [Planctomycetes bacterium Pan216]|uniref:Methionyl-tRNA formyltransferase n=1 Tax=Kolteria novifilia TaxID=2527975 RepID=A0A518BB85_9BACT|nr:Methionyl-tRNA formyltransferase [Planctomycetes bacterium Pan216]